MVKDSPAGRRAQCEGGGAFACASRARPLFCVPENHVPASSNHRQPPGTAEDERRCRPLLWSVSAKDPLSLRVLHC